MPIDEKPYQLKHPVRILTATALFDGHDASINIMRRILQAAGAEVIHLGHNRSADEIVRAAVEEDVSAIAISSYQGGHVEFFGYIMALLKEFKATHIQVFGGGGGVIVPNEITQIESFGVTKIYTPKDGQTLGLQGIVNHLLATVDKKLSIPKVSPLASPRSCADKRGIAECLSLIEILTGANKKPPSWLVKQLATKHKPVPVLGVTGTGGSGKSSLVDEILLRFSHAHPTLNIGVLCVDPTRKRSGGALLGDRIRMNSLHSARIFMRSFATREADQSISFALSGSIALLTSVGFDLIIIETAGIGQGDTAIVPLCDHTLYVMTAEYGAQSQLEKIDMLDYASLIVINKFEHRGAKDAYEEVCKQYQRNHQLFSKALGKMPVFGTIAARFNDDGVTALFQALARLLGFKLKAKSLKIKCSSAKQVIIPANRLFYLDEISHGIKKYHQWVADQVKIMEKCWQLESTLKQLSKEEQAVCKKVLTKKIAILKQQLDSQASIALQAFKKLQTAYEKDELVHQVNDKKQSIKLFNETLCGLKLPKIQLPNHSSEAELLRFTLLENAPGYFPFTAGVFPFLRGDESPRRMFAGEGDAAKTNKRFHFLTKGQKAKRLSTAFDSVTLYGEDAAKRPDIIGKVGTSGVSICTLDDMKILYQGFDLCAPNTSVSMTINGPAPVILAMFFNTVIEQQVALFKKQKKRAPRTKERKAISESALQRVRGTVQADILKEDQGQNTCIFATDFALRMMGDIQEWFVQQQIKNFYSVSIAGYHMAEAGANPICQVAFTLANGFTFVEYYLSRGLNINDFAPNLSFFFSIGLDPEYAVINRVARRIWAITMRDRYGANERSQKLKAHNQTSGRSLHAQEYHFNDIRTTLQALTALSDHCNSLHTNAFDEAITTPSEQSVRSAMAIQLIIEKEYGLYKCENYLQGSYVIETLTKLVEEAILAEFERLSERGGVLGAMERAYQRNQIQQQSLYYEQLKTTGDYPIVGVNTFTNPDAPLVDKIENLELTRSTETEQLLQIKRVNDFHAQHYAKVNQALEDLQAVAISGGNIFAELMKTVKVCSLGQITQALYAVGGKYRRNM